MSDEELVQRGFGYVVAKGRRRHLFFRPIPNYAIAAVVNPACKHFREVEAAKKKEKEDPKEGEHLLQFFIRRIHDDKASTNKKEMKIWKQCLVDITTKNLKTPCQHECRCYEQFLSMDNTVLEKHVTSLYDLACHKKRDQKRILGSFLVGDSMGDEKTQKAQYRLSIKQGGPLVCLDKLSTLTGFGRGDIDLWCREVSNGTLTMFDDDEKEVRIPSEKDRDRKRQNANSKHKLIMSAKRTKATKETQTVTLLANPAKNGRSNTTFAIS